MQTELLACPFCGSTRAPAVRAYESLDFIDQRDCIPGFIAICLASLPHRGCGSATGWQETEEEAVKAWNTRTFQTADDLYAPDIGRPRVPAELYRHVKTGGIYEVICNAQDESAPSRVMVVYRNTATGDRWVRPASEFNDGRFERLGAKL